MAGLKNRAWLLLAATITLQLVLIRTSHVLKHEHNPFQPPLHSILRRSADSPIPHSSLLSVPYGDWYDNSSQFGKPFILFALLVILAFLFSFIGISASDFFCPNLATIAAYLGLNESTAGVTFLAFGNGSPDVFSTFAAIRGGTFSLAIGELIGAATFIISIVVGTIALIKPFHVPRSAFLRDVFFFTAAVILLITVLHDGHLSLHESGAMVVLYLCYVMVVVLGNWWSRRQRRKETYKALGWDNEETGQHHTPASINTRRTSLSPHVPSIHLPDGHEEYAEDEQRSRKSVASSRTASPINGSPALSPQRLKLRRGHSHFSPRTGPEDFEINTPRANFSLLGAIEFRDVVNSLRKETESRGSTPARSPFSEDRGDYFGAAVSDMYEHHGHRRSSSVAAHTHSSLSRISTNVKVRQRSVSNVGPSRSSPVDFPSAHLPSTLETSEGGGSLASSSGSTVRPGHSSTQELRNPWEDQMGKPPSRLATPDLLEPNAKPSRPRVTIPRRKSSGSRIPSISITDPSGLPGAPAPPSEPAYSPPLPSHESRFKIRRKTKRALRILFPSLQSFRHKSIIGMILAVTSVPAILALTLTLPVVDDGPVDEGALALPEDDAEVDNLDQLDHEDEDGDVERIEGDHLLSAEVGEELHHLVGGGFSPLHSPLGRIHHATLRRMASHSSIGHSEHEEENCEDRQDISKEMLDEIHAEEALEFHRGLAAVQCVLGPSFVTLIVFGGTSYLKWIMLASVLAGLIAGVLTVMYATDGSSRPWRLVRCFAGFICAMVWIAAIADEVVTVLQAIGEILGLSDAIIGLTIFAVGNSLADLVANVTVAQFAPAMAYAACFGGPMLNLLLGVGGSGTYHMLSQRHSTPVTLHFSPTLWVSAAGLVFMLVATAIVVPLNGYLIDRRWAICLIVAYGVVMSLNVAVEVKTGRG